MSNRMTKEARDRQRTSLPLCEYCSGRTENPEGLACDCAIWDGYAAAMRTVQLLDELDALERERDEGWDEAEGNEAHVLRLQEQLSEARAYAESYRDRCQEREPIASHIDLDEDYTLPWEEADA